jgi:hypothetical protein
MCCRRVIMPGNENGVLIQGRYWNALRDVVRRRVIAFVSFSDLEIVSLVDVGRFVNS